MMDSVEQVDVALLQAQIDELNKANHVLYENCFRFMKLYRDTVGEISASVCTKLNDLESHIAAMDAKLSLLCLQQGITIDTSLENVSQSVHDMGAAVSQELEDACGKASGNLTNVEKFSRDYHENITAMKESLLSEITRANDEIEQIRQRISVN